MRTSYLSKYYLFRMWRELMRCSADRIFKAKADLSAVKARATVIERIVAGDVTARGDA
jgi:hypothetical protein